MKSNKQSKPTLKQEMASFQQQSRSREAALAQARMLRLGRSDGARGSLPTIKDGNRTRD